MSGVGARCRHAGLLVCVSLLLAACAGHHLGGGGSGDDGIHAFPDNYKADIIAAMHAYLNDPSGIRDAGISTPTIKDVPGSGSRYIVCLRFNAKQSNGAYAGDQQIAAMFLAGRFDDFLDPKSSHKPCASAAYTPFPELEQLKR